jgi:hypothetical protein
LRKFLENDWVRAIELADRTDQDVANRYRSLVQDLLWSILPKTNEEERQQLLALLPALLKTIHDGMHAVGWNASDKQTLMDILFDTHTMVLRGGGANVSASSRASIQKHFKKFVENTEMAQVAPNGNAPTNHKSILEEAMRELDVRINLLDTLFGDDQEMPEEARADDSIPVPELSIVERLKIGVAIEVNLGGKPSLGRLNWINPDVSNLVLTLNDQEEPSMISVRMFQRMLNNDRVRFLETEPIFDRAVESLLIAANQVD